MNKPQNDRKIIRKYPEEAPLELKRPPPLKKFEVGPGPPLSTKGVQKPGHTHPKILEYVTILVVKDLFSQSEASN